MTAVADPRIERPLVTRWVEHLRTEMPGVVAIFLKGATPAKTLQAPSSTSPRFSTRLATRRQRP